ncbi:Cache 3/Cache 2 fusion domain-containing protein [Candidatus Nitrotoga sp. M5]|uniref:Cache 3/Cache 2 fusion domain-containing protein n=1 Tax=Candidatus Nitrotoga sp. M5 TaxID=2890409 RepID=UPI001EF2A706|nr:Cache 3/Cache 2 fusion domain-containing protein [Candidatus Nitrotoga sp. M5]CAH1385384.1 Cache 3/Cache 2 fusion domain-containing protein [Candidatus Nitrotoga sp. M5]
MKITILFLTSLLFMSTAGADDARNTVNELKVKFIKMGEPRLEGVEKSGDIIAPVVYFGKHKINNTYTVVDEIKETSGAYSTVFVKDGDEFIRVSTNVLTPRGVRGVGTKLAHNKAYDAVIKGKVYCGDIDILGNSFYTCYDPFTDKNGEVIGIYLIGFKK